MTATPAGVDYAEIEEKWQSRWQAERIFEAEIESGEEAKKFFITVPYPYTSGPLHIGHGRTYTIGDIIARFKRLQGYNVLFPMAFHVTGTPILAIADGISRGNKEIIERYKEYVAIYEGNDPERVEAIVKSFTKPESVAKFFAERISEDFNRMGYSIDWRRKFDTMEPMYNRFVEWQFKKLYDRGVIKKGQYPITYSIEDDSAVGEDDIEGGDTDKVAIIEHTTIKFKLEVGDKGEDKGEDKDKTPQYLIAATLRPETIFGVTNLWIKPDARYVRVKVGDEFWIVSREAAEKLAYQKGGEIRMGAEEMEGGYLVGKVVKEPVSGREVPVLPASFVDPDVGTGVVYSVPAHAPYDYIAVEDYKREHAREGALGGAGVEIEPIKIIEIEGYELPAKEICERMGIESQRDPRLEEATQIIYKDEFYRGVLNDRCGRFAGIRIAEIKDEVKNWLRAEKIGDVFYEVSRKAVTRSGSKVIVAVLQDQWFIDYRAEWWKDKGHELVSKMLFYPDKYRRYMHDIIDWLALRPCARKRGLGTRFPFDRAWIIESLSDSTIYMALYTIAHLLRELALPPDSLTEEFFDYVFLGQGDVSEVARRVKVDTGTLDRLRREFEYWYPNDLRHTAPPHLSNHLAFFLMHHVAIFPAEKLPRAITLNELMIREGKKMSKSRGNVIPLAKVSELYGVDLYRLYCAINADFGAVVNWREQDVDALRRKFNALIGLFKDSIGADELREEEFTHIDRWLLSRFYRRLRDSIDQFESFRIREAGINMFFEAMNDIRYYEQRANVERRKRIVRNILDAWLLIISPIVPHICEELWHELGHEGFISVARLPEDELRGELIDARVEREEEYLVHLVADIKEILRVARIKPGRIYIYTAEPWKYEVLRAIRDVPDKDKIREAMKLRRDRTTAEFVKRVLKLKKGEEYQYHELNEEAVLAREREYLMQEFGCEVAINEDYDPGDKRKFAIPLKPALYVEE